MTWTAFILKDQLLKKIKPSTNILVKPNYWNNIRTVLLFVIKRNCLQAPRSFWGKENLVLVQSTAGTIPAFSTTCSLGDKSGLTWMPYVKNGGAQIPAERKGKENQRNKNKNM